MRIGYFLSCEEYTPAQLVAQARAAEAAGFEGLWISDHFHPWNDQQGQSPFVWSVIGAISQVCDIPVTTAVTCPTVRMHPAIVAQAAATAAVMTSGRFTLGVGTGEALNEHVLGDAWPSIDIRLEMLEEAIAVMRACGRGLRDGLRAPLQRRPRPHLYPAGRAARGLRLRLRDQVNRSRGACRRWLYLDPARWGAGRPVQGRVRDKPAQAGAKVAYASTEDEGVEHAHRLWANAGLPGAPPRCCRRPSISTGLGSWSPRSRPVRR